MSPHVDPGRVASPDSPERLRVVVETPRGSRTNYEDGDAGLRFDRAFRSTVGYPANYGFVPGTEGGDGDPLDAFVLSSGAPLVPGCVVDVRPVALVRMVDTGERDDKLVTVAKGDPGLSHVRNADDLGHRRTEIAAFLRTYARLEPGKRTEVVDVEDRNVATRAVERALVD